MSLGWSIWISGLSGAGKSTLGRKLLSAFLEHGISTELLEAEDVRRGLGSDLGYSREDRLTSLQRILYCSKLLCKHGVNVIIPAILPFNEGRRQVRQVLPQSLEIHLHIDIAIAEQRDIKNLYRSARRGTLSNVIGVDIPLDRPEGVDLIIDSGQVPATECYEQTWRELVSRGVVPLRGENTSSYCCLTPEEDSKRLMVLRESSSQQS